MKKQTNLSIQKKIILWYAVMLLIIVFLVSAMMFAIATSVLNENIKERLVNVVSSNVDEIEFRSTLQNSEQEEGDQFLSYKDGWLEIDDDFCDVFEGISTALYDEDGTLLYGNAPIRISNSQNLTFLSVRKISFRGENYYVYEKLLNMPGLEKLWLRGVVSQNENINILYNGVRMTFWFLPALAVLALLGGYVIVRRSFLPVEQLAHSAEEIGISGDLSRRLDIGPGGDEIHMLAETFNDMFDRLETNFEAERRFTSDASHELRTPLAVILSQAEYALELADTEEEYREALAIIKKQGTEMTQLISQLLFFTRLEQGTMKISPENISLSQLTEDLCVQFVLANPGAVIGTTNSIELAGSAANSADANPVELTDFAAPETAAVTLHCQIEPDLQTTADTPLFSRVLNNLLSNAYKYGKPGGNIWITLSTSDKAPHSGWTLTVRDDGKGINAENLDKIWNRFYQEDSSRSESDAERGLGLGLSMVKEICQACGWKIGVSSVPGQGSTFTVTGSVLQ